MIINGLDYMKIQEDIAKAANKEMRIQSVISPWYYFRWRNNVCVTEGHIIAAIPDRLFYLDTKKVFFNKKPKEKYKNFIEISAETKRVRDTKSIMPISGEKKKYLRVFENEKDKEEIFVDNILLTKYFEPSVCTFTGINDTSPVFLWENNRVIGCILPVVTEKSFSELPL